MIADDDVLYKVRAIPTQNYKEPTGGLDSETTEKAARIEGKLLISVRTGLTEGGFNRAPREGGQGGYNRGQGGYNRGPREGGQGGSG